MADDEMDHEEMEENPTPEIWLFAKPPVETEEEEDPGQAVKRGGGARVGKLVKFLNDFEDPEELEMKLAERDPATGMSLLQWATLENKFVLVEWLIKTAKRAAFAFANEDKELNVFERWVEVRREIEEREKELAANPPEEEEGEEDEEKPPEPTPAQLVLEGLPDAQEDWGRRAECVVKTVGELGIYQGARDDNMAKAGLGQALYPNGDAFCGEFAGSSRHGQGTYWFQDEGMIYVGQWKHGRRHGVGRMVYPDGGRYYGAFIGDFRQGHGRYTYPDGSTYTGMWSRDVKHGQGTYNFTDGSQHVGAFVDGHFVAGEWRLGGNLRYAGAFKEGVPDGQGVFSFRNGGDGQYRLEGHYKETTWAPGKLTGTAAQPELSIVVQKKRINLTFTCESAALGIDDLVHARNFGPTLEWLAGVEAQSAIRIEGLQVANIARHPNSNAVGEVTLKVKAVDAVTGSRVRSLDFVVLAPPMAKLAVVLVAGDKMVVVLETAPCPSISAEKGADVHATLPAVEVSPSGVMHGSFVSVVERALRVTLRKEHTMPLPIDAAMDSELSSSRVKVMAYVQHVHGDTLATAEQRLSECSESGVSGAMTVALSDIPSVSCDAVTQLTALTLQSMVASNLLPRATVEDQRPPTPIPPAPEPRPDIEPLLEAERRRLEAEREAMEE